MAGWRCLRSLNDDRFSLPPQFHHGCSSLFDRYRALVSESSFVPAAVTSILAYICLDSLFTAPLFTLAMNQTLDVVAPFAYVTTALVITQLMSRVRSSMEEQERAAEALRRLRTEMAHVTRVMTLSELASSIAHEINQPLSAIVNNGSACLRWLANDPPDVSEASEAARDIVRDGNRASEIIKRIRALLRKSETAKAPVNINQIIEEVVMLTSQEAATKGVRYALTWLLICLASQGIACNYSKLF